MTLPRPPEPSPEDVRERADGYEAGLRKFWGAPIDVDERALLKRGMPEYLWEHWEGSGPAYQEVAAATGDIDWVIVGWADGDYQWDELLDKCAARLGRSIE